MKSRFFRRSARSLFLLAGISTVSLCLEAQVPASATPRVKALKPPATLKLEKAPQAQTASEHPREVNLSTLLRNFTLGEFSFSLIELAEGSSLQSASGKATVKLPAPLSDQVVEFRNLSFTGNKAQGSVSLNFQQQVTYQEWSWSFSSLQISDQGSKLGGQVSLGRLQVPLDTLSFSAMGISGTVSLDDLVLAEGSFDAALKGAQLVFGKLDPILLGTLQCALPEGFVRRNDGEPVVWEQPNLSFTASVLARSGPVSKNLWAGLAVQQGGNTYLLQDLDLVYAAGVPVLKGKVRLQLPLDVLCENPQSDQPYISGVTSLEFAAKVPAELLLANKAAPGQQLVQPVKKARALQVSKSKSSADKKARGTQFEAVDKSGLVFTQRSKGAGFTANFTFPGGTFTPSGLTSYRLVLSKAVVAIKNGRQQTEGTRLTGEIQWGEKWVNRAKFTEAAASLADGLYVAAVDFKGPVEVGAFKVSSAENLTTLDFSTGHSPAGLPAAWQGLYVESYVLYLPLDLYFYDHPQNDPAVFARRAVGVGGSDGRFEANGSFSGALHVDPLDGLNLHVSPVSLEAFDLNFRDGCVLQAPRIKGLTELAVSDLFAATLKLPLSFVLTQNGAREVVLSARTSQGSTCVESALTGVDIVLESARLNPSNIDFTGRFDFHAAGAKLPSIDFDHLTLEGSGGGIDEVYSAPTLSMVGAKWDAIAGSPKVKLWGFDTTLMECGYGTIDKSFFVGFGGDVEINPILGTYYNKLLFTTDAATKAKVVKMGDSFSVKQDLGKLAGMDACLDFGVEGVNGEVSDAFFEGNGSLALKVSELNLSVDAGLRFGHKWSGNEDFPYFYALGHAKMPEAGIQIAPDVELFGLAGGVTQNFLPDEIRNTDDISGKPDKSLGMALLAGVDIGSADRFAFHGNMDLYIGQDLTTVLQGTAYLFCDRNTEDENSKVTADIRFTRNPNAFQATFDADISQFGDLVRYAGTVSMRFAPEERYIHFGTKVSPILAKSMFATGSGYLTADWFATGAKFGAGMAWSFDSGEKSFGPVWGRAWINVSGDLVIIVGDQTRIEGVLQADGGAKFGMKFKTFWKTYRLTIFDGDFNANMAFQLPDTPVLSGKVIVHYSVLGGAFSGSTSAKMNF